MDLEAVHAFQDDQVLEFNKALPQSMLVGTFNSKAYVRLISNVLSSREVSSGLVQT